ncbi:MAG TPA: L,D-transpeptidase [Vicinamibacterales bacterium]
MRANRATWTAGVVVAGMLAGTRAQAADAVNSEALGRRVVVSIPDRKLAVVENNAVVQVFDVAVGAPSTPSPSGTFTIVNRVANPTYYHPGTVIAPGARNPIGTRWIGLNQKGYGIHGTDQPSSIGYAKSHGCIRLRNADVERLFERVRPGDVVELHAERTPEIDQLFATVH